MLLAHKGVFLKRLLMIVLIVLSVLLTMGVMVISAQTQIAGLVKVKQVGLEIKRSGTEDWVSISTESIIGAGDLLRTSATGEAEILLFNRNGLIQLMPDTELSINRLERTEQGFLVAIGLLRGRTHQILVPVPEQYIGYEFSTSATHVVTAGGIFDLWVDETQYTNVLTEDGIVYVGTQRAKLTQAQGIRAEANGVLSPVTPAQSVEQLLASIDGVPARFITNADIQLNLRQGPNANTELLGTLFPQQIERVMGISTDGQWYRVRHGTGYAWVSKQGMEIATETEHLVSYRADHIETLVAAETAPVASQVPASAETTLDPSVILQTFSYAELEVIARINEWRIAEGGWPLKPNPTLRDMALAQGNYLLSLSVLPDDLHTDAQGRNPRERALDPAFKWPHYAIKERIAIGENIYIGNNVNLAITYWQNSPIHREAATSTNYREVGAAVLPHPLGNIYVVVFGARPNILPALLDPVSDTLYLSAESYRYAAPGDWLTSVQGFQFIDSVLSPVDNSAWQPYNRQLDSPEAQNFVIAYQGDEKKLLMTNFNPIEDIAWLPNNLPNLQAPEQANASADQDSRLEVPQLSLNNPTSVPRVGGFEYFITNTPAPAIGG